MKSATLYTQETSHHHMNLHSRSPALVPHQKKKKTKRRERFTNTRMLSNKDSKAEINESLDRLK